MFHEMAKYLFISLWIVFLNKSVTWTSNFKRICYLQLEKITTTSNKTGGKKGQNNVDWASLFNDIEINKIVEFDGCHILEEITNNLEKHLKEENKDTDATDGVFDAITALSDEVRGGFDDEKRFLKSLSKMFALLLNAKVGTANKFKKIIRIGIERSIKIWSGQN